jgi:hypothetical protein
MSQTLSKAQLSCLAKLHGSKMPPGQALAETTGLFYFGLRGLQRNPGLVDQDTKEHQSTNPGVRCATLG